MSRNIVEIIIGAVVILVAAGFLVFAYKNTDVGNESEGYHVIAKFEKADGIGLGSDVRVSGIKIGSVSNQALDLKTYQAVIHMNIDEKIKLPKDSSAEIVSSGFLGGKYISISPGGDSEALQAGDEIEFTQSSVNFESLLGKFIFSNADKKSDNKKEDDIKTNVQ